MRLYLMPASGLNSKVVTTGPGLIWVTRAFDVKLMALFFNGAGAEFQGFFIELVGNFAFPQEIDGRKLVDGVGRLGVDGLFGAIGLFPDWAKRIGALWVTALAPDSSSSSATAAPFLPLKMSASVIQMNSFVLFGGIAFAYNLRSDRLRPAMRRSSDRAAHAILFAFVLPIVPAGLGAFENAEFLDAAEGAFGIAGPGVRAAEGESGGEKDGDDEQGQRHDDSATEIKARAQAVRNQRARRPPDGIAPRTSGK